MQSLLEYEQNFVAGLNIYEVIEYLKKCMYGYIILILLRIYNFQFIWIINDLVTGLILMWTLNTQNKCVAIFCFGNCIIGTILCIVSTVIELPKALISSSFSFGIIFIILILAYAIALYGASAFFSFVSIKLFTRILSFNKDQNGDQPTCVANEGGYETFAPEKIEKV
jgi:hypothetical protein